MSYEEMKAAAEIATGLSRGALQIYAAALAQLGAAIVLRRSLADPAPWLAALLLTVLDEWLENKPDGLDLTDVAAAMLIPALLLLVTRFAPAVVLPKRRRDETR